MPRVKNTHKKAAAPAKQRVQKSRKEKKAPKSGQRWTKAEIAYLLKQRSKGVLYREIADELGRTNQGCRLTVYKRGPQAEKEADSPAAPVDDLEAALGLINLSGSTEKLHDIRDRMSFDYLLN